MWGMPMTENSVRGSSREHLYLALAKCPLCEAENRIVETRDHPVNLMQDVAITRGRCTVCGQRVLPDAREWDVHEVTYIERAEDPTEACES